MRTKGGRTPGLVIFDCDGVLVDTEPVANRLLVTILAEAGLTMSYAECRTRFVGRMLEEIQHDIETTLERPLGVDWCADVRARTEGAFAAGIEPIHGIRQQIERLKAEGRTFCVASSGKISKMHVTLGQTGLLPLLSPVLFSAEMVGKGKPAPDLFLHAAREMGYSPQQSIVIEDSLYGVQAGVAAGMKVLGYAADPQSDAAALAEAGATVFHSMDQLPELL